MWKYIEKSRRLPIALGVLSLRIGITKDPVQLASIIEEAKGGEDILSLFLRSWLYGRPEGGAPLPAGCGQAGRAHPAPWSARAGVGARVAGRANAAANFHQGIQGTQCSCVRISFGPVLRDVGHFLLRLTTLSLLYSVEGL